MKAIRKPGVWIVALVSLLTVAHTNSLAKGSSAKKTQTKAAESKKHKSLIHEVSSKRYKKEVLKSKTPVLVDFSATWCQPCKMLEPTLESLSNDYKGKVKFVKVDIDKSKDIAEKYGVQGVPTLIMIKDGKKISKIVGLRPESELKELIDLGRKGKAPEEKG